MGFRITISAMRPHARTRLKSSALFILAGLVSCSTWLAADTYPRQPGIDARHYVFKLTLLTSGSNEIQGETTATLRVVTAGMREAMLDLTSATPDGKGMTVTGVTSAGQPVAFTSERAQYPFAQNRDLLRFSIKTAAAGRAAGCSRPR